MLAVLAPRIVRLAEPADGRVVSVHDGDPLTLLVGLRQVKVRLTEIDAPKIGQAFGRRSRQALAGLCGQREARVVDAGKDRYGRTLGRVHCSGADANAEQIRRGMACFRCRSPHPFGSEPQQVNDFKAKDGKVEFNLKPASGSTAYVDLDVEPAGKMKGWISMGGARAEITFEKEK